MNAKTSKPTHIADEGGLDVIGNSLPPPQLLEQARAILDLCAKRQATREKVRAAEQALSYRRILVTREVRRQRLELAI
jgi:hypothetical protein